MVADENAANNAAAQQAEWQRRQQASSTNPYFRKHTTRSQVRSRLHPNRRCPRRESEATDIEGWGKSSKEELLTEVTKYLVEQGVAEDHSMLRANYAHCLIHRVAVLANQALLRIRESKKKLQAETSQTRTGEVLARLAPSSGGCGSTIRGQPGPIFSGRRPMTKILH